MWLECSDYLISHFRRETLLQQRVMETGADYHVAPEPCRDISRHLLSVIEVTPKGIKNNLIAFDKRFASLGCSSEKMRDKERNIRISHRNACACCGPSSVPRRW